MLLSSCTSSPKQATRSPAADSNGSDLTVVESLELSSEAPTGVSTEASPIETTETARTSEVSGSDSEKVAAILRQLDAPGRSGWTEVSGTGPCPLFETPGEWAFEFDPPAVFCNLSETASVALVPENAFALLSKDRTGIKTFPAIEFDGGTIASFCDDESCFIVWSDGVAGIGRLAADRDEGVTWLQEHVREVLRRGATIDLSLYKFPESGEAAESAVTEVLDTIVPADTVDTVS
jgi:hypothetical protein